MKTFLESNKRCPLVIHAESGAGKTSVMAMVMKNIPVWFDPESIRIIRFIGTSPGSTSVFDTIFSVMGQLADCLDVLLEPIGYKSLSALIKYLPRFLRNISRTYKHPVFILLDSIDQFSGFVEDPFKYIPTELPSNIHIILSTLPEHNGILKNCKTHLPDESCYIAVEPLPLNAGKEIAEAYLKSKKRTLTEEQKNAILEHLMKAPSPLYLKLLLDQSLRWESFKSIDGVIIGDTVRHAIELLFEGMEHTFGTLLVKTCSWFM